VVDSSKPPSVPVAEPPFDGGAGGERLHADPWSPRPDEELRFFFFEGLLETSTGTRSDVEHAVEEIQALSLGEARLDIDGRRARLMLEEGATAGSKLDDKARARLLRALQDFLEASGEARGAESTLRCTEVFRTRVRETLFRPVGGKLEPVCRLRGKTPRDDARAPRGIDARRGIAGFEWRTVIVLLALLFVGFGLSAWSSGWVDRVFAEEASQLALDHGAFEGMLELRLKQRWGKYEIEIRRGPAYPTDPQQVQARLDAAHTTADRACINAVANGEDVYVVIESAAGRALASERVSLRPLLRDGDARVEAKIWGLMLAHKVRISLDDGKRKTEDQ